MWYKGAQLTRQRVDLLVDGKLIVELKSTEKLDAQSPRQLLSYLKASNIELGLLLHFAPKPHFIRVICSNRNKTHLQERPPKAETHSAPEL